MDTKFILTGSDEKFINSELEYEMSIVQQIVSIVHSIRKDNNIKIRQPLNSLTIYSFANIDFINNYVDIIIAENNVKNVYVTNNNSGLFGYKIKPDYKILGCKYGSKLNDIVQELSNISENDIANFVKNEKLLLKSGVELHKDECIFDVVPFIDKCVKKYNNLVVILDTKIDDKLKCEGIARDFIKIVQDFRKKNGFKIEDNVSIYYYTDDVFVKKAIDDNIDFIKGKLLSNSLIFNNNINNMSEFKLNECSIYVNVELLSGNDK